MAPPRMGKAPVSSSSSEEEELKMETAKKRRMDFKVRVRHLLKGKYVNLKSFTTFSFPELLKFQGLHEFITDNGKIYTDLVKSFLNHFTLNLNTDEQHMLYATVRNCEIVTDLGTLAASLKIPYSGFFLRKGVNHEEGKWAQYDKMEYYYSICRFPREVVVSGQRTSRILCYAKNLSVDDRMLHYVICHVLLPKDSNLSQINDLEMQVLFAVKNKIRVNWLPTMLYHLRQQLSLKTRLPYGRLISRILELTDMEIGREPFLAMNTTANEINGVTIMKNTGIIQSNDGSYKYDDGSSSSNFPIPEGGISNEFLYTTMMSHHRETTRSIKSLRNLVLSSRNLPVEDDEGADGSEADGEEDEAGSEEE